MPCSCQSLLGIDCGPGAPSCVRWLPGVRVCAPWFSRGAALGGGAGTGGFRGWVPGLTVSVLDEEEHLRPLPTLCSEEREGRVLVGVWVGVELRLRRVPRQGQQGWEPLLVELSTKGPVWGHLGCRRSINPDWEPRRGLRVGWKSRSEWGPKAPPQPQSDCPVASESFLSASHSC